MCKYSLQLTYKWTRIQRVTLEDLINKAFALLKDRCGGQLGDSGGEGDSSTLQNDGTNPTLTSVLESLCKNTECTDDNHHKMGEWYRREVKHVGWGGGKVQQTEKFTKLNHA